MATKQQKQGTKYDYVSIFVIFYSQSLLHVISCYRAHCQTETVSVLRTSSTTSDELRTENEPAHGHYVYSLCNYQTAVLQLLLNFTDDFVSTEQLTQVGNRQVSLASVQSKIHQAFSKQMSIEELFKWLNSYPGICAEYQEDIENLRGIIVLYITTCMQ